MIWIWALLQALTVVGVLNYWRNLPSDRKEVAPNGVVAILSVRDDWDGGPALIDALKRQSSPFRLIVASLGQCAAAETLAAREGRWVQHVRAGVASDEGQKIHKLRAALRALQATDRWLVFIDADIAPPPRFFGRLLFPLVTDKADISTGYRMLLPARNLMATLVGSVEMQLATLPRSPSATMPWGGAMAMSRDIADKLNLDAVLEGRLSDDMAIGLAGWRMKLRLRPVRDLLVATPLEGSAASLLAFGVRQYRHVLTNSRNMWLAATGAVMVQALFWVWALGWGGWPSVAVGYLAGWGRAFMRSLIIRSVLEPYQVMSARRSLIWDVIAPFAPTFAHLAVQVMAATSNRIVWAGWSYRVKQGRVVEMQRTGA